MTLLEQLTLVDRAIHTLRKIRDDGLVHEGTMADWFASDSFNDLQRLRKYLISAGADPNAVDIGKFVTETFS